jgi:hypothetical protein
LRSRDPEYARKWREENKDRAREHSRKHHLQKKFGLTLTEYDALFVGQGGVCAICATEDTAPWDYFVVDHDHATGAVRALLCAACNTVLGQAKDDPTTLRAAATYLEEYAGT